MEPEPEDSDAPLGEEDYAPLEVTPPQGFDPIFGTWGASGYRVVSEVEVAPQDVLLEVQGDARPRLGLLFLIALGLPLLCLLPAAAEWFTRVAPEDLGVSPLAVVVAVGATGLLVLSLLVLQSASSLLGQGRAQFTAQGILRERPGGSVFVAWEQVTGYRSTERFVAVVGEAGILLSVPTLDAEAQGQVLGLLDQRGVPRLD